MIVKRTFPLVAAVFIAVTGNAVAATSGWTPSQAAAKLKATYTAPDPKAAAVIQANIDQEKAGCSCDTNPRIVSLLASLRSTQKAAKAQSAACKGAGSAVNGRYSSFRCSVRVAGTFRPPPDYVVYSATVKVTVKVAGARWRVVSGWR